MSEKSLALMPLAEVRQLAEAAAKSGLFTAVKTADAAMALMMVSQAEGLHPMMALKRYHIVDGKPSMRSDAMLSEFQARGGRIDWKERSHDAVEAVFHAPGSVTPLTVRWTMDDAKRAGLAHKQNWKGYTRQMLSARVISEGVRMTMPSVVSGFYTPEEVGDFDDKPQYIAPKVLHDPKAVTGYAVDASSEPIPTGTVQPANDVVSKVFPGATELVPCWRRVTAGSKKGGTLEVDWVAMDPQPKRSEAQSARLHILRKERGLSDQEWRTRLQAKFNKESSRDLADFEATQVIEALEKATALHGTAEQKAEKKLRRAIEGQAELAEAAGVDLAATQAAELTGEAE
jgi:hypothetical protein